MRRPKVYWRSLRKEWSRDGWELTDNLWLLGVIICLVLVCVGLLEDDVKLADSDEWVRLTKFDQFRHLSPNGMGDTFAGLFSSLAFIAAIGALLFQRKELVEQREATQDMASSMKAQLAFFEHEKKHRLEVKSHEYLHELLISLTKDVQSLGEGLRWYISDSLDLDEFAPPCGKSFGFGTSHILPDFIEKQLPNLVQKLSEDYPNLLYQASRTDLKQKSVPPKREIIDPLLETVGAIVGLEGELSKGDMEILKRARIKLLNEVMIKIRDTDELWTPL
jgi:hypothetical protein